MTGLSSFSIGWSMSRVGANWPTTWHNLHEPGHCGGEALGDNQAAVGLFDRAIEIRERLVNVEGRRELADDLANLHEQGHCGDSLGDDRAAVVYDRAIDIRERLVNVEGRHELLGDLACVKADRSLALILSGDTLSGEREAP